MKTPESKLHTTPQGDKDTDDRPGFSQAERNRPACENPADFDESPHTVIRGESFNSPPLTKAFRTNKNSLPVHPAKESVIANAALVDYLNCTFKFDGISELGPFFTVLFSVMGDVFAPATNRKRGLHGYKQSYSLGETGALFAFGGNNSTGMLTLPGNACNKVPDWQALVCYLDIERKAKITRWDGAVDDFDGIHSVDDAVNAYKTGLFNAGGRKPKTNQSGNWIDPDGSGRTFYVGKRKNGKLLRVYEKGMQLGIPWHAWVRWEVELHNRDRVIPWNAVLEPGKYVAGAYPKVLDWVSEEQSRIKTLQHESSVSYKSLVHYASAAYGKLINTMLSVEESDERVLEILRQDGTPARLDLATLPGYGTILPRSIDD